MAYRKGQLRQAEGWEGGQVHMLPIVVLPHSCDEWEIGGIAEIDNLIADLQEARKKLEEEPKDA